MHQLTKAQQAAVDRLIRVFPAPPNEGTHWGALAAVEAVLDALPQHDRLFVIGTIDRDRG